MKGELEPQCYGLAMSQGRFGGPRGVWLECRYCPKSDRIKGSRWPASPWKIAPLSEIAKVFRSHGWTGKGDGMKDARCPECSAKQRVELGDSFDLRQTAVSN